MSNFKFAIFGVENDGKMFCWWLQSNLRQTCDTSNPITSQLSNASLAQFEEYPKQNQHLKISLQTKPIKSWDKSKAKKTCSAFQETNFKQYLFETKTYFLSKIYYSSQAIAVKVLHHSLLRQLLCLHTFTFMMAGARKSDNYYASKL